MSDRQRRYGLEEHARLGTAIYERQVRPHVEYDHQGQIVAIDVDTGSFEVGEDTLTASHKLLARCPDAQIWCVRVGYPAVHHIRRRASLLRA